MWYWTFKIAPGIVFKYEASQIDFAERYKYFRSMYKSVRIGYYVTESKR